MLKLLKVNEATDEQVILFCPVGTGLFGLLKLFPDLATIAKNIKLSIHKALIK